MNFTTQPPTKPGFYAWRTDYISLPIARQITISDTHGSLVDALTLQLVSSIGGEWCELVPKDEYGALNEAEEALAQISGIITGIHPGDGEGITYDEIVEQAARFKADKDREIERLRGEVANAWTQGRMSGMSSRGVRIDWANSRAKRVSEGNE